MIGYPQLYMVVFYDLSGFIWDKSTEVGITFLGSLLTFIFLIVYLLVFGGIVIGVLFAGSYFSWPSLISFPIIIALELIVALILYNILINLSAHRLDRLEWKY